MRNPSRKTLAFTLASISGAVLVACGGDDSTPAPTVQLLSSKAEYVSGGDALVSVKSSDTSKALSASLNGTDVSSSFSADPANPGTYIGLVKGLKDGANTLVTSTGGDQATLALTNYPATGPMISGPFMKPFICQTDAFVLPDGTKLGAALDANCSAATKINYVYRSTAGGALKPMTSTASLPADVATTTTTAGTTVAFVVRVETGTMDRGIYQNAVLHDPTKDAAPTPLTPPKGWNRKLIANHGSGCVGGWYIQGAAEGVSPLTGDNLLRLGEGYGIFINTLNHPTNACNAVLAGEAALMGKEHFIETFGVPTYTVSTGGSGGAYTSLQLADAYPGLFDGVLISATFPDALSISMASLDSKLLNKYYQTSNTTGLTEAQIVAVNGNKGTRAWYDLALQSGRTDPVPGRVDPIPAGPLIGGYNPAVWNAAVPVSLRYDPVTNKTGARPTVFDVARNVYGVDKTTGFAFRPFDNVGVQYGLNALNAGTITPRQFIDMNQRVGGYDQDGNYVEGRSAADPEVIKRTYQSGLSLGGNGGLASIPVFDITGLYDDDQFYHYQWFHFAVRERMLQTNGDTRNHVMWRAGTPITEALGTPTPLGTAITTAVSTQSWAAFIKWVDAYKADTSSASQRDKVIANKPAAAVDGCFTKSLTPTFIAEPQTLGSAPTTQCNTLWPSYTTSRIEAGGPVAANKLQCQLKPIVASDYKVALSASELSSLNTIFPKGVCDWSKAGTNQSGVTPYASFGPSPVNLVFDITKP
jgi:hypothetical protein